MILAIEAAVNGGSLSLSTGPDLVAGWVGGANISRAEDLLPAIAQILEKGNFSRSDVSCVAVSTGPGSFTGIRVGLSTAIGLASGLNIPLVTMNILQAMAYAISDEEVLAAIPMGRSAICTQRFSKGEPISPPSTHPETSLKELVAGQAATVAVHESLVLHCSGVRNLVNLGNNLARYCAAFAAAFPDHTEELLFVSKSF